MKTAILFICFLFKPALGASLPLSEWTWIHETSLDDLHIASGSISVSVEESLASCFMACHTHDECLSFFTWTVNGDLFCEMNSKIFVQFEINNFATQATGYMHYKTDPGCPSGFHRFSKPARMCIKLVPHSDKTHADATTCCTNEGPGAELVVLDTDVKRVEVAKTLVANSGFMGRYYWVAADRASDIQPFIWSNGEEVDISFFDATSLVTENCVSTHINVAKTSMDGYTEGCDGLWPYICSLAM